MPFFSLVMPAYNCEKSVGSTINSIVDQEFLDFELIIINDGSTDRTSDVLEEYKKQDKRIKIKTIKNGGPGNARNVGIDEAKGEYLFLIDADDELSIKTLSTYYKYLNQQKYDLIVSSYLLQVINNNEIVSQKKVTTANQEINNHELFLKNIYPLMNEQLMYVIWNKVYKLDIIKQHHIRFPNYCSCEDRLFNIAYFNYVDTCLVTDEILYRYIFDGKNSLTNKFLFNKFDTFVEFRKSLLQLTEYNRAGTEALFLKGVMSCIIPVHSKSCPLNYKEKINYTKNIITDAAVIEASELTLVDNKIRLITKLLFKSKSSFINYYATKVMYLLSITSPKTIEKLKQKF